MCTGGLESFLNSKILGNHFKELCINYSPPYREESPWMNQRKAEINDSLVLFLTQAGRLIREGKVDAETFKNEIKKITDINILHVEILWYLQVAELMTLTEYIQHHERNENEKIINLVSGQVFENMLEYKPGSSKIREAILVDFIKTLFECSNQKTRNSKVSFFETQVNLITKNLQELYDHENCDVGRHIEVSHLMELLHNSELGSDVMKLFLGRIIGAVLESSVHTFKSIFKQQEKLKNHVRDKRIFQFFTVVSKYSDLDFLVSELRIKLMDLSERLNWSHMFCFITFVGSSYQDGWSELKALTNSILKKCFETLDVKLLSHAFLIARQGCFERINNYFPSYLQWFGSTFSSESRRPINCKTICNFFFDFLTELLPYDPPYYLKVHINRVPWVPVDCHPVLHEYVALAKTQLVDLNVSTELGICENLTDKSAPVFDVENVMKHFERTNDILSSVFQASMFCKDYYEKKFLVELLKKFEGKKSTRHKLILKLHSLGKIPNSMFKGYKALEKIK